MYEMTKNDRGPRFFFGRIYEWFVNDRGRLELQKSEATEEEQEQLMDDLIQTAKEIQK